MTLKKLLKVENYFRDLTEINNPTAAIARFIWQILKLIQSQQVAIKT